MSRYNRSNFYPKTEYDNKISYDFLGGTIANFKIKRPVTYYTIRYEDIGRPDLLSYKLYSKVNYWYLLSYVNDIADWWYDVEQNDVIRVPNVKDIEDWFMENK